MASVTNAPVDRSKLDMTANQFPLAGTDVPRALFLAHGTVRATSSRCGPSSAARLSSLTIFFGLR